MKKNTTTISYMKCPFNKTLPFSKAYVSEIKEKISIREHKKIIEIETHTRSLKRKSKLSKNEMEEEMKRMT
jgi:hypothetical protein